MKTTQEFISTGTELHGFGVTDTKGREVGAKVLQGLVVYTEDEKGTRNKKPGTFLTAYVYAARGGKDFCKLSGAHQQFEIVGGNEVAAERDRMAWIAGKLIAAKQRAIKNFA